MEIKITKMKQGEHKTRELKFFVEQIKNSKLCKYKKK